MQIKGHLPTSKVSARSSGFELQQERVLPMRMRSVISACQLYQDIGMVSLEGYSHQTILARSFQRINFLGDGKLTNLKPAHRIILHLNKSEFTGYYLQRTMIMETEDNILIQSVLDGNKLKYQILVERYKKAAYYFALGMVGNSDDAYDLSQEAFIRAYRHLNRFDSRSSFKGWFFTILSNLCKNALRAASVRRKHFVSDNILSLRIASDNADPEQTYVREDIKKKVWNAISQLDEDSREIIILKHFQDMSYKEIAEVLRIPIGSVMSRLYYARQKLKKSLEEMI
ncbi:MAG: sigma-70 family RNA polymerase sigma factor [candidate division Zixibacteria bacterium]|nr:sigma-70 family RNA polymerase sigma factor [candidate division Zixibacteria bacterium]